MEIYAHRGLATNVPENTLAAFRKALRYSYNLELDLRATIDGSVVVIHDETLDATTNGRGLVRNQDAYQIGELRARIRGSPEYAIQAMAFKIPLFKTVLKSLAEFDLSYQIEIKERGLVEKTLHELSCFRVSESRYFFTSFDPDVLAEAKALAPNIERFYLMPPGFSLEESLARLKALQDRGLEIMGVGLGDCVPEHSELGRDKVTSEAVGMFKREGIKVGAYVINTLGRAIQLNSMGIDGIVTDRIDLINERVLHPVSIS